MNITQDMYTQRQDDERTARMEAIHRATIYYEGRHPKTLHVLPGETDDNTIVNCARLVVDKGLSLLFGKEVTWQVDETGANDTPVEEFLDEVWQRNRKQAFLHGLALNGAQAGLAFVKINPTGEKDAHGHPVIDLEATDPSYVETFSTPANCHDIWRYRIEFAAADANGDELHTRQDITRADDGLTWELADYVRRANEQHWRLVKAETWPFPWAPMLHCQNLPAPNCTWGDGDLPDVIPLQDTLNQSASNIRKILRLHGYPQTIVTGGSLKNMEYRGPDRAWEFQNENAKVFNLEMFTDLAAARDFYASTRANLFAIARMVDLSTFQGNLGALTNFGLRVLYADALQKTETKRVLYGGLLVELNRRLAELANFGADTICRLQWPDPLPLNVMELAGEARIKQALGFVSDETLAGQLNLDYAMEQTRLKQQIAAGVTNPSAANMPTPPVVASESLKQ